MRTSAIAALIFANTYDEQLGKLTEQRSMASVPFGGRYRLIDFTLSNLVNAKVSNVGIVTNGNYGSLMDHLGSGLFWDLDRKNGGIRIISPYNTKETRRYKEYVEALMGAMDFLNRCNSEYILLCESGFIANIDVSEVVNSHIKANADVTVVYSHGKIPESLPDATVFKVGADNRVNEITFESGEMEADYLIGMTVVTRTKLIEMVKNAYEQDASSIYKDVLAPEVKKLYINAYKHSGYSFVMDSETSFYDANMQLLNEDVRKDLFNKARPVYTKTRDDMPTRYSTKADVKNSFIADGCVIEGTVKNSVLFRGVKVKEGAVVENSIIMQGGVIGANVTLDYVISDKDAAVVDGMTLKGTKEKKFFVKKNQVV